MKTNETAEFYGRKLRQPYSGPNAAERAEMKLRDALRQVFAETRAAFPVVTIANARDAQAFREKRTAELLAE